ncbi:MAG TPA: hypothetical protein VGO19_08060 [Actinomycetes bacterium]|jgi:hypothetical protein
MRLSGALLLARPASSADRTRSLLVATTTGVAGALLVAAARIARLSLDTDGSSSGYGLIPRTGSEGLVPYVSQAGLRPGVVLGVLLLTVPVLALAVQALRTGSVARDRKLSSVRLAGATPGEVRRIAAVEAGGAALLGGLLAGPVYLVLYVLLGALPSAGHRLLPSPDRVDLLGWLAVVVLTLLGGLVAGGLVARRIVVDPLGVRRRTRDVPPGRVALAVTLLSAAGLVTGVTVVRLGPAHWWFPMVLVLVSLLVMVFAGAPAAVAALGRRRARSADAADLLAGLRVAAAPRSNGRVAAVLLVCGVAFGVQAVLVGDLLHEHDLGEDASFYLGGHALAAAGVVVALAVAVVTLVVGMSDALLEARRPLAALRALGVQESELERSLRAQSSTGTVLAVVLGTLLGAVGITTLIAGDGEWSHEAGRAALPVAATALVTALLVRLLVHGSARLLRGALRAATDPENLRVA